MLLVLAQAGGDQVQPGSQSVAGLCNLELDDGGSLGEVLGIPAEFLVSDCLGALG